MSKSFGDSDPRPSTLTDAFWHALTNRRLLAMYGLTFLLAVAIPLIVTLAIRKWRERALGRQRRQREGHCEEEEDDESQSGKHALGAFNKSILNSLRHFEIRSEKGGDNENESDGEHSHSESPFIPSDRLKLKGDEEEEGGGEADQSPLIGQQNSGEEEKPLLPKEEPKKKKKPRKKYKDPDPETVEELRKLTEKGLHGKLATAQLRAKTQLLEEQMSDEEREKEHKARQDQLEAIFRMMETQKEKFGINDQDELAEQMKMYSV